MYYAAAAAAAHTRVQAMVGSTVDTQARSSAQEMELKLERQNLVIQTLLMLLLEKGVIHDQEFREWLAYVDGLDGKVDGRVREDKSPVACPKCGRNSPRQSPSCQYCGEALPADYLARRPQNP
ncbi:MAG: hypothetical protein RLY93_15645 [Sumerlaeia bacterium]